MQACTYPYIHPRHARNECITKHATRLLVEDVGGHDLGELLLPEAERVLQGEAHALEEQSCRRVRVGFDWLRCLCLCVCK